MTTKKTDEQIPFHETEEVPHVPGETPATNTETSLTVSGRIEILPEQFDVGKATISEWNEKVKNFSIYDDKGEFSKEKYEEAKVEKAKAVQWRNRAKDKGDLLKEDAKKYTTAVNDYVKELWEAISIGESIMAAEIKKYNDEKERRKKEKEEAEQKQYNDRLHLIMSYGMAYVGSEYTNGDMIISPAMMKDMNENDFIEFSDTLKIVHERKQAEAEAKEAKAKQENIKLESDKKLLEEQQAALKKQQDDFNAQQELFKKQQDELKVQQEKQESDRKAAEQKKIDDENAAKEKAESNRLAAMRVQESTRQNELMALGLAYNTEASGFAYLDVNVSFVELKMMEPEPWRELISKITPVIAERKAAELLRIQREKEVSDKRIADEAAAKALKDAEDAKIAEAAEAARLAALMPDKEKLTAWAVYLSEIKPIEVKDPAADALVKAAIGLINKVSVYILDGVEKLK